MTTKVLVPEVWKDSRTFFRGVVLFFGSFFGFCVLTLPLLLIDAVWWIIGLGAAMSAAGVFVYKRLQREQAADIQKNGPFYVFEGDELLLPETRGSTKVSLVGAEILSWRINASSRSGEHWPARGYLRIRSGESSLLFESATNTGNFYTLDLLKADESVKLWEKCQLIRVDTAAMMEAIAFLKKPRVEPAFAAKKEPVTDKKEPATPAVSVSTPAPASGDTPERRKQREEAVKEALRVPSYSSAAVVKTESVDENNILSRLARGTISEVPEELLEFVRNYRERGDATLLHSQSYGRSVSVLLEAGLDPCAVDANGRTTLMVYGRAPWMNLKLLDAGAQAEAVCNRGHNAVYYQATPQGVGFVCPDLKGVQVLFDAGLPIPTREVAQEWKEWAASCVTAAGESSDCNRYCKWLDEITGVTPA